MVTSLICPNPKLIADDPRFDEVRKAYKNRHYPDDFLVNALLMARERLEKDENWFPSSGSDKGVFTNYIDNYYTTRVEAMPTDSKETKDTLKNIYDTLYKLYTPEELDDVLDVVMEGFQREVDKLEQDRSALGRSRQDLITAQAEGKRNGYKVIMARVFDNFQKNYTAKALFDRWKKAHPDATAEEEANAFSFLEERADEYSVIVQNQKQLSALAAPRIGEIEGFRVDINGFTVELVDEEDDAENTDTENGEDKTEGSKGDRYGDYRTVKLMNSISPRARRLFSRIPRTNQNGEKVYGFLGNTKYIDPRQAIMALQKTIVNSEPETMMDDLREAVDTYPWLGKLVQMLDDNKDLRQTVWVASKRAESIYVYTDTSKGGFSVHVSNSRSRGNAIMQEAGNNLRGGFVQDERFCIYTGYGALKSKDAIDKIREEYKAVAQKVKDLSATIVMVEKASSLKDRYMDDVIAELNKKYGGDHSYLKLPASEAMEALLSHYPDFVTDVTALLRGFGFAISEKNVRDMALQPISKKSFNFFARHWGYKTGRNRLFQLVDKLDDIYKAADTAWDNGIGTGQYLYNIGSDAYRKINNIIALSQYNDMESRVVVEGKSFTTYNQVNPLHQVFDFLKNKAQKSEDSFQEALQNEFLQYEGNSIGTGTLQQVYGWLKKIQENKENERDTYFQVVDATTIFHKEYARMTRAQKQLNAIAMFFQQAMPGAMYEVTIQGDYSTAYNFVSAPKIGLNSSIFALKEGETNDLVEAFVDEVLLEIDRISAIERRACPQIYDNDGKLVDNPEYDPNRAVLSVYEKEGRKFQIFPEFNETNVRGKLRGLSSDAIRTLLREEVKDQMRKIVRRDADTLERDGVFLSRQLKNYGFYDKDGKFANLSDKGRLKLEEYFLNVYYARQQIAKLVVGGTAQFDGLIDFEKRNMFSHATHTSVYTEATWKGEPVGRKEQKCAYVEDDSVKSAMMGEIDELLQQLLAEEFITKEQYQTMSDAYGKIKTTDGQALRTFDSHRVNMIMADQWTDRMEDAYWNIKQGRPTKGDIDLFIGQIVKPIYNGYEHIDAAAGENQKPVKLTTLHKYAEMILLPQTLAKYCLQTKSAPFQAFEAANKALGGDVDVFLFHSCVKVGYHSGVQPFAKWKDLTKEEREARGYNGEDLDSRILSSPKDIANYIVQSIRDNKWSIHTLPYKYWGIAASTPAHAADDKIAWASQAEKVAWANVLKGQKIMVNGREMDAWEAREKYFDIKTANIIDDFNELRNFFRSPDELARVFRQEIAEQGYTSDEMLFVLSRLQDGTFALPLFTPNVQHQVEQVMSAIIKKRLTKPKQKGANILQATSLGMDVDLSVFTGEKSLPEDQKLKIVFEGIGKNRRIKYVEVYLPLTDSRLKQFADKNGNLGPERLKQLVDDKKLPEEILQFIAYRTPSDAEHSVIPCRVKGFLANAGGATIIMPKEIMNMTGHDYDGDKMRCHFADFNIVWDEDKLHKEYLKYQNGSSKEDIVRYMLGLSEHAYLPEEHEDISEEEFIKRLKRRERELQSAEFKKAEYVQYDYDKSALDNSRTARENARIQLMFSKLTSPEGSRRMVIPGGCEPTKIMAKTMYVMNHATDRSARVKVGSKLLSQEKGKKNPLSKEQIAEAVSSTEGMYNLLMKRSDRELSDIMRMLAGSEAPYSVTHAVDAFEYIMGGSEMIGIYALYNSAMQMLQRLNLSYVEKQSKKNPNNTCKVTMFGVTFGKEPMFQVRNHDKQLAILGLARLLNAAVDNNKDPLLGHLNQTKEMAELTFFLFANGLTEEEIHLIMNQPIVKELIRRRKSRDSKGLVGDANEIINELKEDKKFVDDISQWKGVANVGKMQKSDFIKNLGRSYDELKDSANRFDLIEPQISLLQTLIHINPAVTTLAEFAKLTRPESESGAIGSSVQDLISKHLDLQEFRAKLKQKDAAQELRISLNDMEDVMAERNIWEGTGKDYIREVAGSKLPEIVSLDTLMIDYGLEMFRPYFPQVKDSWISFIEEILGGYKKLSQKQKSAKIGDIVGELILFKLLEDKTFVAGDPQEEQKRILGYTEDGGVPWQLKQLKERIAKAQEARGKINLSRAVRRNGQLGYYDDKGRFHEIDEAADELVGNLFLQKLTFSSPEEGKVPRIRFDMGGPAIANQADTIRQYWNMMLESSDKDIRKLAFDLFKYNLYTNGFSYGMYEFAHFAPFSLIMDMPGYVDALNRILRSAGWKNKEEKENFLNQYYMNHWGDDNFVPQISDWEGIKRIKRPDGTRGISPESSPESLKIFEDNRYIVDVLQAEDGYEYTLYRVDPGDTTAAFILREATKLGTVNRNQQVTLNYSPSVNYATIQPVSVPNKTPWHDLRTISAQEAYAESDITAPDNRREKQAPEPDVQKEGLAFLTRYIADKSNKTKKLDEKAAEVAPSNDSVLDTLQRPSATDNELPPAPTEDDELVEVKDDFSHMGLGNSSIASILAGGGKQLSIVRYDEEGNLVSENVPATPDNISLARKQKIFVELNKRLREILREKGIAVGTLFDSEARLSIGGITDFDTARVLAEGLKELIRIADGYEGEQALPEEFAHVALEMLGHDHPLVTRLLNALRNNESAMREAFGGMYEEYVEAYGDDKEKLVLEAAGKLVAKRLFMEQEIQTKPVRNLIQRIIDAIKNLFRRFRREEIEEAIFDAEGIASKIAREMLGGKLLDDMSIDNIESDGVMLKKVAQDLSGKEDILSKLLKREVKRLDIFKKRLAYVQNTKGSRALDDTEEQILKLQRAIRNHKTEEAVVSYIKDAMEFLAATNDSLVNSIKSGAKVNSICRKLNTVRDTLYSFSMSVKDIRDSLAEGEIQDTIGLQDSLNELEGKLGQYFANYNHIAMRYFEEMLSGVYGDRGLEVTIGKDKGRKISIHEMATRADRDISFAARWFNSVADCDDYVLKAIDDIVRDAKLKARSRTSEIRREIEVAFADLVRETGSSDQSFMFERQKVDGKMVRTGKYISAKEAESLPEPQQKFYKVMMAIKDKMDDILPESLIEDLKIVMVPKTAMEKYKSAEGAGNKALMAWEGLRNRIMDLSDDVDYEYENVAKDFEGNKVDNLPVKFLLKGKKQSYDDMTEDVATSMMAYVGMALEYDELNSVIGILENARYMASQREIGQRTGWRKQREAVGSPVKDYAFYREPFTVKQARSNIMGAMNDFYQMHIYGHLQKDEGTVGHTRISVRGAVNTANRIASLSQMAINLSQRIANITTGQTQIIIESAGKGVYNGKDLLWAGRVYAAQTGDRLMETGKTDPDNKLSLFDEKFDIHQNNGKKIPNYQRGRLSRVFNTSLMYAGLTIGEDYLANMTALAAARNFKMLDAEGKESNLWEAYEVRYTAGSKETRDGRGAYLAIKEGWRKADGMELTAEDERAFAKSVIGLNFDLQGIYNDDDRSAIQQHAFGALLIMYRKWIAPALKRRYGRTQYSKLKGDYVEGYYRTLFSLMRNIVLDTKEQVSEKESEEEMSRIVRDTQALMNAVKVNWKKLSAYEKSNCMRSFTELSIMLGLAVAAGLLGKIPPEESKEMKWFDKTLTAQLLRLRTEIGSQAPTPLMVSEATKILKSPFAALRPLQDSLNIFKLLYIPNYTTEIKSGRYKGHTRAYKYFHELPGISMWKRIDNFIDPSPLINYYKNDSVL